MGDLLDFELEELSAAFAGMDKQYASSKHDRIEIGYQEEENPHQSLLDLDENLIAVSRRSSFADPHCGDQSPILRPAKRSKMVVTADDSQAQPKTKEGMKRTSSDVSLEDRCDTAKIAKKGRGLSKVSPPGGESEVVDATTEVKERKCFREKKRRAELNAAYDSLAKTLSLPPKCKKTALLQKAEETIKALRQHILTLQEAQQRSSVSTTSGKPMTVPVPWMLGPLLKDGNAKARDKSSNQSEAVVAPQSAQSDELAEKSLVAQMKVCIERMIKLTEMKQAQKQSDSSITHSHCA